MVIKTVTVVGANGTMGTNVSAIFASFGGATVYMVSRDREKSNRAAVKAGKTVKADSIGNHLITADYSMLAECVNVSDLVFESAAEDLELKIELHTKIGKCLKKGAVACTGSSGLSITRLAECYPLEVRSQFFGVHMFNPPYQLTLCELTASPYSDMQMYGELKDYLTNTLYRTVAESKDLPAFLGNRIGFYFMNEALLYAEQYQDNGGVDFIDALLGPFTGRTMPPITTADFVGLDVHKAIVDNIYENTNDYVHEKFVLPGYVQKLIDQKKLGRKSGEGLYKLIKNDSGDKRMMVYDIKTGMYRDEIKYSFPFVLRMKAFLRDGDYDDAIRELINGYVRTVANATIGLEFATAPQKYLLGITDEQFSAVIDNKFKQYVGNILAATTNPETGEKPTFGQLQQGTLSPHVEMIRVLATQFSAATGLPVTDTGVVNDANPTSSDAIMAQTKTLVGMAEELNAGNGESLRTIALMAMAIAQNKKIDELTDDEKAVVAHFKNPAMPSIAATTDAAMKIASVRNSFAETDTFLEMVGFDQADIRRIKNQEQRARGLALVAELENEDNTSGME